MSNSRTSKRRYPARHCKQCGIKFIPSDKRQCYCSPQHRIDFNNDQRAIKEGPLKLFNSKIINNEKILIKAAASLIRLNQRYITLEMLEYENFNFDISSSISVNERTGKKIYWSFTHGIEGIDAKNKLFRIWKI